jgi:transcriptional regulator with XRE-family HTH domain
VDTTSELSQFPASRRAAVTPERAGLPNHGRRQVPGLRSEEVASLAGVSVEYYKRLERGNATGASDSVLDAIADALQPDDAERAHLFDLARAAAPTGRRPPRSWSRPCARRPGATPMPASCRPRGRVVDPRRAVSQVVGGSQRPLPPDRTERLRHPVVGELELSYEVMELAADRAAFVSPSFKPSPAARHGRHWTSWPAGRPRRQPDPAADEAPRS